MREVAIVVVHGLKDIAADDLLVLIELGRIVERGGFLGGRAEAIAYPVVLIGMVSTGILLASGGGDATGVRIVAEGVGELLISLSGSAVKALAIGAVCLAVT